jgi:hypothetical protein
VEDIKGLLGLFKQKIDDFSKKHKKEISEHPKFRLKFDDLYKQINIDGISS